MSRRLLRPYTLSGLNQSPIDNVFFVKQHVVPLDGTDVLNQGHIDAIFLGVAFTNNSLNLLNLPAFENRFVKPRSLSTSISKSGNRICLVSHAFKFSSLAA